MYKYRLTKRGKVVVSIFISVMLWVTYTISRNINAKADSTEMIVKNSEAPTANLKVGQGGTKNFTYYLKANDNHNKQTVPFEDNGLIKKILKTNSEEPSTKSHRNEIITVPVEQAYASDGRKLAFLTFDDGPSKNITPQILNILDRYDIKATFFVLGKLCSSNSEVLQRIAKDGQAIGIHTYSHDYKRVYNSADSFLKEIKNTDSALKRILGDQFQTRLFRFPGGSSFSRAVPYKKVLENEGYTYIDWNALTGDAEAQGITPAKLLERLKTTSKNKKHLVILMHDSATKYTTVEALPKVIDYLKAQGYRFAILK